MKEIENKVKEFITENDKPDVLKICTGAVEFMIKNGITFTDAMYTVKEIVYVMRNNYGD